MSDAPETFSFRQGGLLRCCIQTLSEYAQAGVLSKWKGEIVHCSYCTGGEMVYTAAHWLSDGGEVSASGDRPSDSGCWVWKGKVL